jgi:carboxymethylenebutenolidase
MSRLLHERPLALAAAARYPDRICGCGLVLWDLARQRRGGKPASVIEQGQGELYIACAEHDALAPLSMVDELRTLFARAATASEMELYFGVHHGFAFPQRWCYDKPAAERHWECLIALYRRHLG